MKNRLSPNGLTVIAFLVGAVLGAIAIAEELGTGNTDGRAFRVLLYCALPVAIALIVRAGALSRARVSPLQQLGLRTLKASKSPGVVVADSDKGPVVLAMVNSSKEYLALLEKNKFPAQHTLVVASQVQRQWQAEIEAALKSGR